MNKPNLQKLISMVLCLCLFAAALTATSFAAEIKGTIANTAFVTSENGDEVVVKTNTVYTDVISDKTNSSGGGGGGGSSYYVPETTEKTDSSKLSASTNETETEKTTDNDFEDTPNHWAYDYVEYLHDKGIAEGDNNLYMPDLSTKRGDFAIILSRLLQLDKGSVTFSDVPQNSYWQQAIAACAESGIYIGYGDGTFKPEQYISREEMMVIIAKLSIEDSSVLLSDYNGYDVRNYPTLTAFADGGEVSWWSAPSVSYLVGAGIVNGDNNNRIRPKEYVTRAEMAVVVYNFLLNK